MSRGGHRSRCRDAAAGCAAGKAWGVYSRYKGGKRQGKAPIELLAGEALEADWVDLLIQHKQEASPDAAVAPTPSLELVPHCHEGRRQAVDAEAA